MTTRNIFCLAILFSLLLVYSCKKDDVIVHPDADFTASKTTVVVDEEIQFTNKSANATAFKWSFGDGTTSTEVAPKKSYQSSDVFLVSLVSTGAGGSKITSMEITVLPFAAFTVDNEDLLSSGVPVQFRSTSKGATSFEWSFGDAAHSISTDENPTFTYTTGGSFTVTLKAISAVGATSVSKNISVAIGASPKTLFFIDYGTGLLQKLPLDGSSVSTVLDINGKAGVGLAYDDVNEKIYFSDFEVTPEGKIWRMNPDGSSLEAIVTGIADPYGIALDVAGGKVYWTDDAGNISRANLDGTSQEIGIVNIAAGQMRAIALDPENNKMYFYEVNAEILYVANLDGSNPLPLVTGVYGYGILVDTVNDKIYFDDQNSATLIRTNLDGTGGITVDDNGTRIYGLAIDYTDNKLYWSARDTGELYRADLDGANHEVLLTGLTSPRGLFLKQ
ncbi:MAG: PKD domain-containing protein [Saprospiraceae bacterium]